ncbi:molybdate ABC transporter substrate-binding protein [Carboxydothermus pertinax]|uniref:Molybdate ABC transporter substrate-binding protein n=1 Tax=Carboxydothermus pertinax TaxID=870242 RepID=A0A1L8CVM7_9THEO|nr:molybdate ABC transporter substrate-binding protein [Carboxydothermus pertinax]GAV22978.1 molybdate ABC transporter substrate-binding protein [Carboxydothermus pertinax]
MTGRKQLIVGFFLSFLALGSVFLTAGCTESSGKKPQEVEILVGAAADLQGAFKEIGQRFTQKTGIKVNYSFGSSGILTEQIENGAPIDVFASADQSYVKRLEKKNLVFSDSLKVYARGKIVLAQAKNHTLRLNTLNDLLNPRIKKIAIANPKHAPYGKAAQEALQNAGLWRRLKDKIVYGNNIRDTQTLVETGNTDAGILALSLVKDTKLNYLLVAQNLYKPLDQTIAVVKGSKYEKAARKFVEFVSGNEGQKILKKYGFEIPK